jgi:CHASE2 domain-containing sensor protein
MILGMSTAVFTQFHVLISLVGIVSGLIVAAGLVANKRLPGWTELFLITTIATSATGFLFHSEKFGPPHVIGVISLVILAVAIGARYGMALAGNARWIYVVTALLALYFNVFVAVIQSFQKLAFLHPLAPTGTEPPFAIAQGIVLLAFIGIGTLALKRFHPVRA